MKLDMTRILLALAVFAVPAALAAHAGPPNIIHFMADDLGWNDLGHFNGGKPVHVIASSLPDRW